MYMGTTTLLEAVQQDKDRPWEKKGGYFFHSDFSYLLIQRLTFLPQRLPTIHRLFHRFTFFKPPPTLKLLFPTSAASKELNLKAWQSL